MAHRAVVQALSISNARVAEAPEPLLVLELDHRMAGETHDLRPLIPVVIRR